MPLEPSTPPSNVPAPRLELRAVSKAFGATRALAAVSLSVEPSEVHVILGENGAGKSTLIRILSGVYQDFTGELLLDGRQVRFREPAEARAQGIATIHQELSLVPALSVADNALINEPGPSLGLWRRREARERARALLDLVGLELDVDRPVETLSLSERQLLEIARCISARARIFIMDEPTSALSRPEAERLFALIERIVASGRSVIYISHRLDEIYRVGQRVSVLRDGALVFTRALSEVGEQALVQSMVGRAFSQAPRPATAETGAPPRLQAAGLARTRLPRFEDVSVEVARGEIVGLAGLRDSGAAEVLAALCGAEPLARGALVIDGRAQVLRGPDAAAVDGVAFVPSDRKRSIFYDLSALHNASLAALRRFVRGGVLDSARERAEVASGVARFKIKLSELSAPAGTLSGGNQQKLALLRAVLSGPKILLLDDPTRGVDVAAKRDIHELVRALSSEGVAVLLHSTDLDELTALCSRVLVLFRGRVAGTLSGAELSRDRLLSAMMGIGT